MTKLVLHAAPRASKGTGDSRRLRRSGDSVPGIIYGGQKESVQVTFSGREIRKIMEEETFYSHIVSVFREDQEERVVLRELQRHPAKQASILHLDFMRVAEDQRIDVRIPLHFINEAKCFGVKNQGGSLARAMNEVEVNCLTGKMPDFIEVDVIELQLREAVHLSDLKMPEDVILVALKHDTNHDLPVVSVQPPRVVLEEEEEEEVVATEAEEEQPSED